MYLGQGLLASQYLPEGEKIDNLYRIEIPRTAVSPAELELVVGLYDHSVPFNERLTLPDGQTTWTIDTLRADPN